MKVPLFGFDRRWSPTFGESHQILKAFYTLHFVSLPSQNRSWLRESLAGGTVCSAFVKALRGQQHGALQLFVREGLDNQVVTS
jgi:hypothetical protein